MENEITNKIIACISNEDMIMDYTQYELTFDSSNEDILNKVRGSIEEKFGISLKDESGHWLYKTTKATNTGNIYIQPNSTAGN